MAIYPQEIHGSCVFFGTNKLEPYIKLLYGQHFLYFKIKKVFIQFCNQWSNQTGINVKIDIYISLEMLDQKALDDFFIYP